MDINRILQKRNNRLIYYLKGIGKVAYPKSLLKLNYDKIESKIKIRDIDILHNRLDYYNKRTKKFTLPDNAKRLVDITLRGSSSMYWFDFMEYARFFPKFNRVSYLFGDVTIIPEIPTFVKSRPISYSGRDNSNSVLCKLCKVRHFLFVDDKTAFRNKHSKIIWRGGVHKNKPHRIRFMQQFFNKSSLIDVAQHNKSGNLNPQWQKPFMTIQKQLQYKFILSIEGNDVATNTKWIMSSNSLLFMAKPKYETWFMEGRLVPGLHYVMLKDDYSDLEEKVEYYIRNPEEAEYIVRNANLYVSQFKDQNAEDWLSLKVLERYFRYSEQLRFGVGGGYGQNVHLFVL
jgi:hypothetical protein